jgi:PAS domain S-box-containing protein
MATTLLLVDDEDDIRTFLGLSLADLGYEVLTAADGRQALEVFAAHRPPIVLTDIKMPGMDGIALLRRIKEQSPDTEVVMISGHADMDLAIKSLKFQAADFVTKPINDEVLEMTLARVSEKIAMRAELRRHTENLERLVEEKSQRIVQLERQAAVGQVVESLSGAIRDIAGDIEDSAATLSDLPCFISIHNQYMEVVSANALYRARLGEMTGRGSWEVYAGVEPRDCPVGRTFRSGAAQRMEMTVRTAQGERVPVLVHTAPIRGGDGEVELVLEITADLTTISRLQEELRATQAKYQLLFDEAPCFISVQDRQFRITAANRLFKEHFGAPGDGVRCHTVYAHRDAPCDKCPVARTFETGQSHQWETVVTSRAGKPYNVLLWTAPIRDASGAITEVMEMATDITQLRELQDHLASLGLMIGSMSHGIKGMLTALDGGVYRVESGFRNGDDQRVQSGWGTVKDMVSRIRSMVLQMLHYAKHRELNWAATDLGAFFESVARLVEPKAQKNGVAFVRSLPPGDLGSFEADATMLSAALVNLLENAVDACVDDAAKPRHSVTFGVRADEQGLTFTVADDGTGIDRETRERMFTLFFSSKGCKGTGLGLFVSDKTIRQHGGSISVDSEPGRGSTFTIRLPRVLPDAAKACAEGA